VEAEEGAGDGEGMLLGEEPELVAEEDSLSANLNKY